MHMTPEGLGPEPEPEPSAANYKSTVPALKCPPVKKREEFNIS